MGIVIQNNLSGLLNKSIDSIEVAQVDVGKLEAGDISSIGNISPSSLLKTQDKVSDFSFKTFNYLFINKVIIPE